MKIKILYLLLIINCIFIISCNKQNDYEMPEFDVYFCPKDDCENAIYNFINETNKEIKCAFFELNLEKIINLFKEKNNIDIELLIDHRYEKYVKDLDFVQIINRSGLMHNKYCIRDNEYILTGSTNPTYNCVNRNNNNLII
ncbi:MAG: phospholipase D-like domain-containing protein, partial [Candidatus Woesearchaeota archaeon]